MKVWVTRTRPGAKRTAARLTSLGLEPLIDPVLEVRPLETRLNLEGVQALAFTSPNAVQIFAGLSDERRITAYAVGEVTRDALMAAGFQKVLTAGGDVRSLAERLRQDRPGRVLHPAPAEPAADLAALCAGAGVEVRGQAIYETVPVRPETALTTDDLNAVMVHSPRAGEELARIAPDRLTGLTVAALSEACAGPLRAVQTGRIVIAPFPDDATLVRLTLQALSEAPE